MYIPEVQNDKNSNELPVFIYRKSYKGYFCICRGPKEILRGPKKQSSLMGSADQARPWGAQATQPNRASKSYGLKKKIIKSNIHTSLK